jgi:hypothetical protein
VKYALLTSAVIALVAVAADAHSDDAQAASVGWAPPRERSDRGGHSEDTVVRREVTVAPSAAFIASGTIALSLGYGVASVLAISSTYDKDRLLFIPIAGPWIDLGLRPPGTSDENWARVGLIVDGVAQLAGLVLVITGLVMKQHAPRSIAALVTPTTTGVSLSF